MKPSLEGYVVGGVVRGVFMAGDELVMTRARFGSILKSCMNGVYSLVCEVGEGIC